MVEFQNKAALSATWLLGVWEGRWAVLVNDDSRGRKVDSEGVWVLHELQE